MTPLVEVVVGAASITTAAAASAAYRKVSQAADDAEKAVRLLTGEDDVDGDDGVVGRLEDVEDDVQAAQAAVEDVDSRVRQLRVQLAKRDILDDA